MARRLEDGYASPTDNSNKRAENNDRTPGKSGGERSGRRLRKRTSATKQPLTTSVRKLQPPKVD